LQCIRCYCEEVHSLGSIGPDGLQAAFRLETPYAGEPWPIDVETLLQTSQDEVWPDAEEALEAVAGPHGIPSLGATKKVVVHMPVLDRSSWCRLVPWC